MSPDFPIHTLSSEFDSGLPQAQGAGARRLPASSGVIAERRRRGDLASALPADQRLLRMASHRIPFESLSAAERSRLMADNDRLRQQLRDRHRLADLAGNSRAIRRRLRPDRPGRALRAQRVPAGRGRRREDAGRACHPRSVDAVRAVRSSPSAARRCSRRTSMPSCSDSDVATSARRATSAAVPAGRRVERCFSMTSPTLVRSRSRRLLRLARDRTWDTTRQRARAGERARDRGHDSRSRSRRSRRADADGSLGAPWRVDDFRCRRSASERRDLPVLDRPVRRAVCARTRARRPRRVHPRDGHADELRLARQRGSVARAPSSGPWS